MFLRERASLKRKNNQTYSDPLRGTRSPGSGAPTRRRLCPQRPAPLGTNSPPASGPHRVTLQIGASQNSFAKPTPGSNNGLTKPFDQKGKAKRSCPSICLSPKSPEQQTKIAQRFNKPFHLRIQECPFGFPFKPRRSLKQRHMGKSPAVELQSPVS